LDEFLMDIKAIEHDHLLLRASGGRTGRTVRVGDVRQLSIRALGASG
jgi:hypothetical protein